MTLRRRSILSALAALPLAAAMMVESAPALARHPACPAAGPPGLVVEPVMAPLQHDFTRTFAQLTAMPGRGPAPAGVSAGHVLGLAHAVYGERSQVEAVFQARRDGTLCGVITRLVVQFGFQERTVMVGRELPRNSCIHGEVLRHEMMHVAVDERLLKEFLPTLSRQLQATLSRIGPAQGRTQDQVMATLRRPVDQALKKAMADFARERDRRQARVDTREEYERVNRSCGGELKHYVKPGQGRL